MSIKLRRLHSSQGFTIIELMIALSALSLILVMATVIMIRIGALYTKGVNGAALQNATRTISADMAAALQFSGGTSLKVQTNAGVICIGRVRYSYVLNRELGTDDGKASGDATKVTPHVLWRDTLASDSTACSRVTNFGNAGDINNPSDLSSKHDGYEMAPEHTRLTKFDATLVSDGLYTINTWMIYGDNDLIHTASPPTCNGDTGNEFCAISQLTTTIRQRLY